MNKAARPTPKTFAGEPSCASALVRSAKSALINKNCVSVDFVREKPRDLKTLLGIFYTPVPLAEVLVNWAVRKPNEKVFEPSFGGCGFLNAIARRLLELGQVNPWDCICGCDIDRRAFKFLPEQFRTIDSSKNFRHGDFLDLTPKDFPVQSFDSIVGNPPYVSRDTMSRKQIASAEACLSLAQKKINLRASLWAYFVLHSLDFLKVGGRIAWVLPRSLTQAFYGQELLRILQQRFKSMLVISLGQRMFQEAGTSEISDVLVADGFSGSELLLGRMGHVNADSIEALQEILAGDQLPIPIVEVSNALAGASRAVSLHTVEKASVVFVFNLPECKPLADLFQIRIGLVTGASEFFLFSKDQLGQHGLKISDCDLVISKYRQAGGIELTNEDVACLASSNERVWLLKCSQRKISQRVRAYLSTFPLESREKVKTFKKRKPWHNLDDKLVPHAFLPCLVGGNPRLVLNTARRNCTNNVLRVWFNEPIGFSAELFAISLLSTFGQVAAEAFGRACGSGGLKIEPNDWTKVKLLLPVNCDSQVVKSTFARINHLLHLGDLETARSQADQLLMRAVPALRESPEIIVNLKSALKRLQGERKSTK